MLVIPKVRRAEDFLRLLPQRVGDADHGGQLSAYGQVQVRILRRQGVKAILFALRNDAALILKDEVGAADEDPLLIDGACDAVSHQILHLKNGTPHVANYEAWLPPQ